MASKTLEIKYLPANPASSCRGIHESLINYGGNKMPEVLTCMHEEFAVGMAHGYFKIAGKPLMTLCHGTVGEKRARLEMSFKSGTQPGANDVIVDEVRG